MSMAIINAVTGFLSTQSGVAMAFAAVSSIPVSGVVIVDHFKKKQIDGQSRDYDLAA